MSVKATRKWPYGFEWECGLTCRVFLPPAQWQTTTAVEAQRIYMIRPPSDIRLHLPDPQRFPAPGRLYIVYRYIDGDTAKQDVFVECLTGGSIVALQRARMLMQMANNAVSGTAEVWVDGLSLQDPCVAACGLSSLPYGLVKLWF